MGTSAAVMWATLYYTYHEEHCLLPQHGEHLLYYRCFVGDILLVWVGNKTTDWQLFFDNVDTFRVLNCDIHDQEISKSVLFLDLTLTIDGN